MTTGTLPPASADCTHPPACVSKSSPGLWRCVACGRWWKEEGGRLEEVADAPCSACGGQGYIGGEPGKGSWETLCPICLDEP